MVTIIQMEPVSVEINMKIYHNFDSHSEIYRGESKCPEHTEEKTSQATSTQKNGLGLMH